jgi:hypothetical protein
MVPDTRLRNDRNVTAECLEPFLQQQDIFLRRQIYIGITVLAMIGMPVTLKAFVRKEGVQ